MSIPDQFETDTVSASSDPTPRPLATTTSPSPSPSPSPSQLPRPQRQHLPHRLSHHQPSASISSDEPYDQRHAPSHSQTASVAAAHQPVTTSSPTNSSHPRTSSSASRTNIIKRKPLSSTAQAFAIRFSQGSAASSVPSPLDLPKPDHRFSRSGSVDSPTLYEYPTSSRRDTLPTSAAVKHEIPSADSQSIPTTENHKIDPGSQTDQSDDALSGYDDLLSDLAPDVGSAATPKAAAFEQRDSDHDVVDDDDTNDDDKSTYSDPIDRYQSPPPMFAARPTPPHLHIQTDDSSVTQDASPRPDNESPSSAQLNKPLPKSPSGGAPSPFAAFFGWGNPSPSATEFSSIPSPQTPARRGTAHDVPQTQLIRSLSDSKAYDGAGNALGYCESFLSTPPPSSYATPALVEEMEEELKAISSELAGSIRREMDLEDLVDRLQEQVNNPQPPSKRTSDYFSDSGYGSVKASETEQSRDEVGKVQRRSEQEKASIRLELTSKLQEERSKRRELDQQIKDLAERASHIDLAQINSVDANERVRDLENTCEDLRRRLSEERSSKGNFEDLLKALKTELQDACNERDNLRDEVVPQLRSRVEGLETEAAEYANLTYESTKMQQELQTLKEENTTLRRGSVMAEAPSRASRVMSGSLSRSNSVAATMRSQRTPMGLSRSNSVKTGPVESREALAERLKDVEAQRDALHGALKNLLERQEFQNREYQKRIHLLETERERLVTGPTKRGGFEREIMTLRTEINVLRRRAEDALEQKWQVEKGLGGLKMDLDRAEGEIASLRALLDEKDILIPETLARASSSSNGSSSGAPVTSESLRIAYQQLQAAYKESLERIKELEAGVASDEQTLLAMQRLEDAVSVAVTERDEVRNELDALRRQYDQASASEARSVEAERDMASDLVESAQQVEQLACQVHQQLAANANLRMRLADAVTRGDTDRKANNDRITSLMERLRGLEDQLVAAQSASEDSVNRHEEEIAKLRDAHNGHLRRMDGSPAMGGLRSPALRTSRKGSLLPTPINTSSPFPASPRLAAVSFEDEAEMGALRAKVLELEKALSDTEQEMQEVVTRMSTAQVEVLNLQEERDAAVRETRRLQRVLEGEQMRAFEDRFKTLQGSVAA
ncbi:intracellular protein transport protein [Emericellopsis atlantica]|uniref:Intracellular protein transport protein n=1 Tax=Emericellopsis atlantica TaxID=2614577 RepID=A0A9P8CJN6_9HYPO|nr:intracellular protein transport protein [Emericellopsis atlantica]KAG9249659.1 intracellular protein transport protein [Emericellopsis atlantica]